MTEPTATPPNTLRSFGLLVGGVLMAWGGYRLWRGKAPAAWNGTTVALALGAALALLGLLIPGVLRLPYRAWMAIGHVLGALNTRILLLVVYWLLIVPIGLTRRILFGTSLDAKPRQGEDGQRSFWIAPREDPRGAKHYENMF